MWSAFGGKKSHKSDGLNLDLLTAINRSQSLIEFDLNGHVLSANANFLNLMGYSASELVGKHHSAFVDPGEMQKPAYRQFWADLKRGIPQKGEFRRQTRDGRNVYLEAVYNPILDRSGQPYKIVKIASDVTARKLRDLDLEGKVAAISRSQAVIEFALDGTVITANDAFLKVMGYGLDEIVGRHHRMFVMEKRR